jgi:hypothetical protein
MATDEPVLSDAQESCVASTGQIAVRSATLLDLEEVVRVCDLAWKGIWQGSKQEFAARIAAFPECGIVVGMVDGRIEGYVSVQLADEVTISRPTWDEATDCGRFTGSHNPLGEWLHGVGLAVTPEGSKAGLTMRLILFLYDFAVRENKKGCRFITRIPGYRRNQGGMSPEEYVLSLRRNMPGDPELRILRNYGFRAVDPPVIFRDYVTGGGDPGSCGFGVLVEQLNPHWVELKH